MGRTQSNTQWSTLDGRRIPLRKLEDQHLANIYWYHKTMGVIIHLEVGKEIIKRFNSFIPTLEYKPLPVSGEIDMLRKEGMIHGTDIIFEGTKIGTISHIN